MKGFWFVGLKPWRIYLNHQQTLNVCLHSADDVSTLRNYKNEHCDSCSIEIDRSTVAKCSLRVDVQRRWRPTLFKRSLLYYGTSGTYGIVKDNQPFAIRTVFRPRLSIEQCRNSGQIYQIVSFCCRLYVTYLRSSLSAVTECLAARRR